MIERLLMIACAAYLLAASPADAQRDSGRDGCGGDACATDAPYDLGYHDGYEGNSFTASSELKIDPLYQAGFSEGEMDAVAEKDASTVEKQVREDRLDHHIEDAPTARRGPMDRAQNRQSEEGLNLQAERAVAGQADSTLDGLLSDGSDMATMAEDDALTAQEQTGGWRQMDRRRERHIDPEAGLLTTERDANW